MRILDAADITERLRHERVHERDARIVGSLDLEGRKLDHPLILENCHVEEPVNLSGADAPSVRLRGCQLWGFHADQLHTRGDLDLGGVTTRGTGVDLIGANIGGSLNLDGADLSNVGDVALVADRAIVGQNVTCRSASISGTLRMVSAEIRGQLVFHDTRLFAPADSSFHGEHLVVGRALRCVGEFTSIGRFGLTGAKVRGDVELNGATFRNWMDAALDLADAELGQDLLCCQLTAHGAVVLRELHVRGNALFLKASLHNPCDIALRAEGLKVDKGLSCRWMNVRGQVDLLDATIARSLDLGCVSITAPGTVALVAMNVTVGSDMFGDGLVVRGETSLSIARIGGSLQLTDATLINPVGEALTAIELSVAQAAHLSGDFEAHGSVTLAMSTARWISLTGAKIVTDHRPALNLRLITIEQELRLGADVETVNCHAAKINTLILSFPRPPEAVDFDDAHVGLLADKPTGWPQNVSLHGFTYDRLKDGNTPVRERVEYLRRHTGYEPGVYDNLAAAYRRGGRVEHARRVNIAKQQHRRTELTRLGKAWNWLLFLTVGYGYRTSQAWIWLAALLGGGTAVYATAEKTATATTVQAFNPFVYALDVLLPIVDLGQEKAWVVKSAAQYVSWGLIAAGWVLTTAVVAGLTNALKRD